MPPLSNSDHSSIEIKLELSNSRPTSTNLRRQVWNYEDADFNRACELIDSIDWDSMLTEDIRSSLFLWHERFMSIMENVYHMPLSYLTATPIHHGYPETLFDSYGSEIDCANRKECLLPL